MRRIELAESVGLTASGVTRLLLPMEKIRLIEKERNPRDARVSLVKLSATGQQILSEAQLTFEHVAEEMLGAITENQSKQWLSMTAAVL